MTIDLGFAWLTLPSGERVGIVDVPGHKDFIKNMLAGVGGIDAALFVVAAGMYSTGAIVVPEGDGWRIRWFTPTAEVDLCGHATVASAAVLCERVGTDADPLRFESRSGPLVVTRAGDDYVLDFPARPATPAASATAEAVASGLEPPPEPPPPALALIITG